MFPGHIGIARATMNAELEPFVGLGLTMSSVPCMGDCLSVFTIREMLSNGELDEALAAGWGMYM